MADKQLHFFPGPQKLIWLVNGKSAITADARGGEEPVRGQRYDIMKPSPTTPGRFIIYSYAPYVTNTWPWSRIAWGTKLSLDAERRHVVYATGTSKKPWLRVEDKIPGLSIAEIRKAYFNLYGRSGKYDSDHDGMPDSWVFNDFGARAVRYYKDNNKNGKLDKGESLSGEMIHTTPDNEADVAQGRTVQLAPSHGCIHIDPVKRDKFLAAGAFERGIVLIIHRYTEEVPATMK